MAGIYVTGAQQTNFEGAVLLKYDDGSASTVYELACSSATLNISDNAAYPVLIDDTQIPVNKVLGPRVGAFSCTGVWKNDHMMVSGSPNKHLLNQMFGPRTAAGQIYPWLGALVPYSGGTPVLFAGFFPHSFDLMGAYGQSGGDSAWGWSLQGPVADPLNVIGNAGGYTAAPSTSAPGPGTGISTYIPSATTNGAASSPTIYDVVNSVRLSLNNGLIMIPASYASSLGAPNRICAGFVPGPLQGALALTQLDNASYAVPQSLGATNGLYPIDLVIPDGSGTNSYHIALSTSWDVVTDSNAARAIGRQMIMYTLFSTNANNITSTGNTDNGTNPWPFVPSYGATPSYA